jgi:hypothetical protein
MGETSSPYHMGQGMVFMKEFTMGDRKKPSNVFRWERMRLNLPTTQGYDPMIPWVSKRRKDGVLATAFSPTWMICGPWHHRTWNDGKPLVGSHQCAIIWASITPRESKGDQIQHRGPIFSHQLDGVKVLDTQEKWDKKKHLLAALTCELAEGVWLNFKSLESARGFMIYVSRTYRPIILFLLGIHHTLGSWRPN